MIMGSLSPSWRIRGGQVLTPAPFLVAGVINVTPDSFSDGGMFTAPGAAVARVREIIAQGAQIVDVGAESTRPGAEDIGHAEEWRRLAPVLEDTLRLRDSLPADGSGPPPLSVAVDTFRAKTAAKALDMAAGPDAPHLAADIINDVSGGSFDPAMDDVLAGCKPGYVLGHSPARPALMQQNPRYDDVVDELLHWFSSRMNALVKAGLPEECVCLDPCIGFGKTLEHTLAIIAAIPRFLALGRPLYFGISRKSFLGAVTGQAVHERDTSTQVATALLAQAGVAIHRVHQVADTAATLKLVRAFSGNASICRQTRKAY